MAIALIGYRGTGKTAVAQQLALRLGWNWVDADVEIELRAGKSIAAIFADDGEPAFRDLETAVLTDLIERPRTVLALGGGVVLRAENRELLCRAGCVIWLKAEPETIERRIAEDATTAARRPNLTASGGIAEIRQLLIERSPHYAACADHHFDTEGKTPAEVAAEILEAVGPLR